MTTSDHILFDSNVLVYNQNIDDPLFTRAQAFHQKVFNNEVRGVISSQNITEFTAIITNLKRTTKPLSPDQALEEIKKYLNPVSNFEIIYPNTLTLEIFQDLMKSSKRRSQRIFDVFLVATMLGNNVKTILTANVDDFKEFKDRIKIISLSSLLLVL